MAKKSKGVKKTKGGKGGERKKPARKGYGGETGTGRNKVKVKRQVTPKTKTAKEVFPPGSPSGGGD